MTDEQKSEWSEWANLKVGYIFSKINEILKKQDYLVNDTFSAADICVSYGLQRIMKDPKGNDYPKVKDYFERISNRKAAKKSGVFEH